MRLDDCDLAGIDVVSAAPLVRSAPEEEWVNALKNRGRHREIVASTHTGRSQRYG